MRHPQSWIRFARFLKLFLKLLPIELVQGETCQDLDAVPQYPLCQGKRGALLRVAPLRAALMTGFSR